MNIALCRFLHNHGNITTEGSPKPGLRPIFISDRQGYFIDLTKVWRLRYFTKGRYILLSCYDCI